ncbi:hypothetical protein D593_1830 [Streptococcus intermedius BA1]|uniref:hypothetical protein n=1 Tax=Streptococcus intermedius TaxID=1338 RepID=UPI00029C0D99|nr:hypothetical protein [Streptococcus intermedius]EKU16211.1 hypothetical protein D593_1830 [Streptococcus intermedius BA1]
MLTSTGILLFLPKIMGIEDYGYWQLYMFYLVYTGYLSFGTNEGALSDIVVKIIQSYQKS